MKTFDEAFSEIVHDPIILENLRDTKSFMQNSVCTEIIIHESEQLFAKLEAANTVVDCLSASCAALHTVFGLGVLCGQRMERQELPE